MPNNKKLKKLRGKKWKPFSNFFGRQLYDHEKNLEKNWLKYKLTRKTVL